MNIRDQSPLMHFHFFVKFFVFFVVKVKHMYLSHCCADVNNPDLKRGELLLTFTSDVQTRCSLSPTLRKFHKATGGVTFK